MIDFGKVIQILLQGAPFIAGFAAVIAAVLMYRVTQKFGSGILAFGFRSVTLGVFFLSIGMMIDAFTADAVTQGGPLSIVVLVAKGGFFILGTYTIVIGSKRMADGLESLL